MKTALACLLLFAAPAIADPEVDWIRVSPQGKLVKFENSHVRVTEVTMVPGQKDPEHTHPANLAYLLTSGKLRIHYRGQKKPVDFEGQVGEVIWSDPEGLHTVENIGPAPLRFVSVELRDLPLGGGAKETPAPKKKKK
jgi:quercetin dioxygenase-like cupin family protein